MDIRDSINEFFVKEEEEETIEQAELSGQANKSAQNAGNLAADLKIATLNRVKNIK
jgi:hypothetical protein